MNHRASLTLYRGMHRLALATICVLATVSPSVAKTTAKPQKETLTFAGKKRTYYVFAPSGLNSSAPVLLLLHGSGRDGMSLISPWKDLAQRAGIILVAPDSNNPDVWDQRIDGPDFLTTVLKEVESKYSVDQRRVYLFGHSAGAAYALYLSIAESEYFAATTIHAGALLRSNFKLISSAKRKTPIGIWVGTVDRSFPVEQVKETRDAFVARGFPVELHVISFHDHNYYVIAGEVNAAAWQFLKTKSLESEPRAHAPAAPQQLPPSAPGAQNLSDVQPPPTADLSVWANAKPYMDNPLQELTAEIRELHGIDAAPDQQTLPEILQKTADKSLDLLKKMPNVISHEKVATEVEPRGPSWQQQFEYLVLRHDASGEVALDEYRTGKHTSDPAPLSQGTVNAWVLFHPANLAESRFRYLGRQRTDGHATLVLAFAQIPEKVKFPGQVDFLGTTVPVIFQGIAWIDEEDFRIIRLRTDLLAPRPDIRLKKLSSEVRFQEVRIPVQNVPVSLWLPREAKITWDFNGQVVQQVHTYSGFRTYRSKSRIIMPGGAQP